MAPDRKRRQEAILSLIRDKPIRNQNELLEGLERSGVSLTQSTLSRELKTLGIGKAPDGRGGYRYVAGAAAGEGPLAPVAAFVLSLESAKNFVVVKTPPGNAMGVARAIDEVEWPEIMGTIAGDDTILIIGRSDADAQAVEKRLRAVSGR
ncbi:MAG TPA: arginine repressor [Vicinamibacteria bacterium]|nr:arginine repressor [Vicinamibacteria bacterium]